MITDYDDDSSRRLVCAIIARAEKEAMYGTGRERAIARYWLRSDYARHLAQLIGLGDIWPPTGAMLDEYARDHPRPKHTCKRAKSKPANKRTA